MIRLSSQRFSLFCKNQAKQFNLWQSSEKNIQLKYFFASLRTKEDFIAKLSSGKLYEVLGYSSETNTSTLSDAQIKRQYLGMIKKYHSDSVVDPVQKLENQQITKSIIQAYDKLSNERVQNQINTGIYEKIYKNEDEIAMKIYGKKFNEIKYELFKEGNAKQRSEFMEELEKIKKDSKNYQSSQTNSSSSNNYSSNNQSSTSQSNLSNPIIWIGLGAVFAFILYDYNNKSQSHIQKGERNKEKLNLGSEKIKQIENRSIQKHEKKLSDLIESFTQQQPPSLRYPNGRDPDQLDQLLQYTIGPDISLYQVPSDLMASKKNLQSLKQIKTFQEIKNKFQHFQLFQLSKIKVNTNITLSLQAQRCLQNIYIKVKDVAEEIQKTGKYTPPKVFFRYYGYLMFEIRDKPLSLQNYRNTQYISLFDLFFDYYSPIPHKRHQYNQYLVGMGDQNQRLYGQVHLNHRKIPERYITKDDKIVVMKQEIVDSQNKYEQIWKDFYRKYMRIWNRQNYGRISTEHL